jgi:hypothetical protein
MNIDRRPATFDVRGSRSFFESCGAVKGLFPFGWREASDKSKRLLPVPIEQKALADAKKDARGRRLIPSDCRLSREYRQTEGWRGLVSRERSTGANVEDGFGGRVERAE